MCSIVQHALAFVVCRRRAVTSSFTDKWQYDAPSPNSSHLDRLPALLTRPCPKSSDRPERACAMPLCRCTQAPSSHHGRGRAGACTVINSTTKKHKNRNAGLRVRRNEERKDRGKDSLCRCTLGDICLCMGLHSHPSIYAHKCKLVHVMYMYGCMCVCVYAHTDMYIYQ